MSTETKQKSDSSCLLSVEREQSAPRHTYGHDWNIDILFLVAVDP